MLFNSYIFIFLFLPLTLSGWFLFNHFHRYKTAQFYLVLMSLWFYAYFHVSYGVILLASIAGNYLVSAGFSTKIVREHKNLHRCLTVLGVGFNLGLLFYYKYYDFFAETCNWIFKTNWTIKNILLPLGISFFTFQQLGFLLDRASGSAPHYSLLDYAAFITYFPQLVAGPIVHHAELVPQFQDRELRKFSYAGFSRGIMLFVTGLSKKVLLADTLAVFVNYGWENLEALDSVSALFVMLAYTFEIFFDFSGYSDMALGIGRMMNIRLPENFRSPYQSCSIREFWKRWHITLNRFFTRYVYIPLGGSRRGRKRTLCNIMIVFLLSGLWHGADWTFLLWGLLHGGIVVLENIADASKAPAPRRFWKWGATFLLVNFLWVLFRADNLESAGMFYRRLFSFTWNGSVLSLANMLSGSAFTYLVESVLQRLSGRLVGVFYFLCMLLVFIVSAFCCKGKNALSLTEGCRFDKKTACIFSVLFALSVISLSGVTTFLYFNF